MKKQERVSTGAKTKNAEVVRMYRKDKQPYIETTITIRTPLRGTEILNNLKVTPTAIEPVLKGINEDIENIMTESFEADVVSVYSGVRNFLS